MKPPKPHRPPHQHTRKQPQVHGRTADRRHSRGAHAPHHHAPKDSAPSMRTRTQGSWQPCPHVRTHATYLCTCARMRALSALRPTPAPHGYDHTGMPHKTEGRPLSVHPVAPAYLPMCARSLPPTCAPTPSRRARPTVRRPATAAQPHRLALPPPLPPLRYRPSRACSWSECPNTSAWG